MRRWAAATSAGWVVSYVLGCGGPGVHAHLASLVDRGAYTEAVAATRTPGREPKLEKALAEVLLEAAAKSADSDRRRRAFTELSLAGTRSRDVLSRLATAERPVTRAQAWAAAMRMGDGSARDRLRELSHASDPELSALGFEALDPIKDRQQLVAALTEPNRARRAAAVRVLRAAPQDAELRAALEAVARYDPDAGIRAESLVALSNQGPPAAAAIERALDDEAEQVRLSAASALGSFVHGCAADESGGANATRDVCDRAHLLARLGRDLGGAPTAETLAAAGVLLRLPDAPEPERARDVFSRALVAGDAKLRGRAAALCRTLAKGGCEQAVLHERLMDEPNAEVKLLVALAVDPADPLARSVLRLLARDSKVEVAVEASSELAASGDADAQLALGRALQHQEPAVRVSALRALARLSRAGALSATEGGIDARIADRLGDRDERVRVAAAAAVLGTS